MSNDGIFVPSEPEEPPITNEDELAADAEFSKLEKSEAYVGINANWAKISGIWAVFFAIVFCGFMLAWLLFELAKHLSDNTDLLISFLIAVWEALKNGAAVSFPILLYFTRKKDSDK